MIPEKCMCKNETFCIFRRNPSTNLEKPSALWKKAFPFSKEAFQLVAKTTLRMHVQKNVPNVFLRHVSHVFNPTTAEDFLLHQVNFYLYSYSHKRSSHGRSSLQVCQRRGWALFQVFPHLTTKEQPCHVYNVLMPPKQIIGQTITYNGAASGFKVKSWRYTTLWAAPCHREHGVTCGLHRISFISHTKLTLGWALI